MSSRRTWKWFSAGQKASWPANHKQCRSCGDLKAFEEFHRLSHGLYGLANDCKSCRKPKSQKDYKKKSFEQKLFERAKSRATKLRREFTITPNDIHIPDVCPILKIAMTSPSLDRIDSAKGYTPDNIQVISSRANMLKNNGRLEEFEAIVAWMKEQLEHGK